jgi:hypothetical protein
MRMMAERITSERGANMARRNWNMRVSEEEFAAIKRLARTEKIPLATFIRQQLLFEAERRGIFVMPENEQRIGMAEPFAATS